MVKDRGGRVVVVCRAPLARLLATCAGVDRVVVEGSPIPDCDVHAPLMSLPGIFGTDGDERAGERPLPVRRSGPDRRLGRGPGPRRRASASASPGRGIPGTSGTACARSASSGSSRSRAGPASGSTACRRAMGSEQIAGLGGPLPGHRPGRPARRPDGHRGGDDEPRPGDLGRHVAGASGRCARRAGLGGAAGRGRLAMDVGPRRLPLVPHACGYSARRDGATGTTSSPGSPRRSTSWIGRREASPCADGRCRHSSPYHESTKVRKRERGAPRRCSACPGSSSVSCFRTFVLS